MDDRKQINGGDYLKTRLILGQSSGGYVDTYFEKQFSNDRSVYDFHCHLSDLANVFGKSVVLSKLIDGNLYVNTSCGTEAELRAVQELSESIPSQITISAGIHPWNAESLSFFSVIESAAAHGAIAAIGEVGFDFCHDSKRVTLKQQEQAFLLQVRLAGAYHLPVIIHCCKGLECIFKFAQELALIRDVVFHGWTGNATTAGQILDKGINAYFSFGRRLLDNNAHLDGCIRFLPSERILFETDAPFQSVQNDIGSWQSTLLQVAQKAATLKDCTVEQLQIMQHQFWSRLFKNQQA